MRWPIRIRLISPLIVLLVGSAAAIAQQKPFTLEQLMSAPFPADLVAAPAGGKVAWVFDARGVRNIWVAEPPDYKGRALTFYTEDDGQEIDELAWTPDASAIVYVRGGDFETQREAPNPRSSPEGVEQDFWLVRLRAARRENWVKGILLPFRPSSGAVAYIYKDQVWMANT